MAVDPHVFETEYWGRKPLLSRAAALPRDFADLLSPHAVDELIAERGVRAPFIRLAKDGALLPKDSYLGPAGFGAEIADQVDSAKVLAQFAAGATIVLQGLHRLWPPLIDFVGAAVDDLGHPVQANAYITPPSNRGFDPHYDVHDVFVLQVAGQKRWVLHQPVHHHPLPDQPWTDHRDAISRAVARDPVIDTTLSAGDALYIPRGWLHSAVAAQDTSIHLTIGVSTLTGYDVARAIVDQLADTETFRRSLPIGFGAAGRDDMTAAVSKIAADLLAGLRDDAAQLSENAARQLTIRHGRNTRADAVRPLATLDTIAHAGQVAVRWRHGLVAVAEPSGDRVALRLPGSTITFPAPCGPAVAALQQGCVLDAGHTPGLDHDDATVLIARLLREGVVTALPDAARDIGSVATS